ncbi:Putative serine/threonine-protein kinase, active [Septoria linicola]|uniref:Serine/threonine-protein kinase BUR1 n=1 Tax=Septoria linicola TaxID=215465 RepID=A0A9Q9ARV3_9PEZI|nr:putative serine/threonine-protein kinase, active [Septoria linicola]USW51400.1 Putative serine/threonine-protein kinase, active [Septoria linicola]
MSQVASPSAAGMTDPTERRFRGSAKIAEYEIMKEKLGEGTFGVVSKAKSKRTGAIVALKKILMHNEKEGFPITALREVKLLKMLSHPNILRLEEMAVERQQGDDKGKSGKKRATLYMVTPYMDHDLSGMLTNPDIRFTDAQVKCYMLQLLEGLRYLHDSHILHRDMKAANILISNKGILQIADFGLARHYEGDTPVPGHGNGRATRDYTSLVVTRWYRPPELLLTLKRYTPAIDMWGVGCVFAEMFERKPILEGRSDVDQCVKIFKLLGSPTQETMPGWSELPGCEGTNTWEKQRGDIDKRFARVGPEGLDLLKSMLCLDWRRRINAIDALQHKYFKVAPLPLKPEDIPRYEDSHELDSRRRGKQENQRALPPAPAGGTVGMGPDEWGHGPPNGSYQNGYNDRGGRGYGRDRGPPGAYPPPRYDDRRPPPLPAGGRQPAFRERDGRDRPPPSSNGHALPPRPVDLPPRPPVGIPERAAIPDSRPPPSSGPPPGRRDLGPNVDTYIPSYQGGGRPYDNRPPPRDDYDRPPRRDSRDREPGYRESDGPRYRDPDAPPPRQYRDADAPRSDLRDDPYRDRDRRRDYPPSDSRRTRSRSPDRERRERTERLQHRERELYRR